MEGKIAWLIVLSFFILAQSLYMALKIIRERNTKKVNDRSDKGDNPYGERIKGLEVKVEGLEESNENDHELIRKENEKDHELIRRDIRKIFNLINGMRKK